MTFKRVFLSGAAIAGLSTQGSLADVTAEEVWTNLMAPSEAFGFSVEGAPIRDGNRLMAEEITLAYELPLGLGRLQMQVNGMTLEEQGDGTVEVIYPDPLRYALTGAFAGDTDFSVAFEMSGVGTNTRASGDPGRVTYKSVYQDVQFRMTDFQASGELDMEIELEGEISGSGIYTITEGEIVTVEIVGDNETTDFRSVTRDALAGVSTARQVLTGGSSELMVAIPAGQMNPMNWADALRAGLMMSAKNTGGSVRTENETTAEGLRIVQNASYEMTDLDFSLNADGFETGGQYEDLEFEFRFEPEMPFPIIGKMASTEGRLALPLLRSDDPKTAVLMMSMNELSLNEELWALVDVDGVLPRDPMTFVLDMSGEVMVFRDILDIAQMMAVDVSVEPLGELRSLTLNRLQLLAAGSELTGSGSFTFDNSDLETFPGLPAPTGAIDLVVNGANGLLDKLVQIGLLPEDQAMGARMMIGLFGTPGEGEDEITSKIEITEDGQVLANGQRLR